MPVCNREREDTASHAVATGVPGIGVEVEVDSIPGVIVGMGSGVAVEIAAPVAVREGRGVTVGAETFVAVGDERGVTVGVDISVMVGAGIGTRVDVNKREVDEAVTVVGLALPKSAAEGLGSNVEVGVGD